jgi:hypothetical protein
MTLKEFLTFMSDKSKSGSFSLKDNNGVERVMTAEHPDYEIKFIDTFLTELEKQKDDFTEKILKEVAYLSLTPYEKDRIRKEKEHLELSNANVQHACLLQCWEMTSRLC